MNNQRRREIEKIVVGVELTGEDLRRHQSDYPSLERLFAPLTEQLATVRNEEAESLQSMPIGLRNGFRGQVAKERLGYLNEAVSIAEALEEQTIDDLEIPYHLGNISKALENAMA